MEKNKFSPKLDDKGRRAVVDDVAAGMDVNRAAEKYGIQPPSVWNLVYKAAFREAMRVIGLPGTRADEYLRIQAAAASAKGSARPSSAPSLSEADDQHSRLREAAANAAAALQELAAVGTIGPSRRPPWMGEDKPFGKAIAIEPMNHGEVEPTGIASD